MTFTEKKTQLIRPSLRLTRHWLSMNCREEGEGSCLAHTDGFSAATEGKTATAALNDYTKAEDAKKAEANKDGVRSSAWISRT